MFVPSPAALNPHAPGDLRTCQKHSAWAPGASRPWHRTRTCGYLHAPRIALELTRLFTHPTWMLCLWSILTRHDGPAVPVREDCAGGGGSIIRAVRGGQVLGRNNASVSAALLSRVGFGSSCHTEGEPYLATANTASRMKSEM